MQGIFETLFLLACLQGVLLSVVLFTRKENHAANIILGIATFTLSLNLFTSYYYATGLYKTYTWFMGITYPFPYLYGPLFYIYAKLISKKEEKFDIKNLLHFIPVVIIYISVSYVFFYTTEEKILFVEKMISNDQAFIYTIIESLIPVQGIIYTILTIKVVTNYNSTIKNSYSNIDRINLNWLKYLTIGMIVIWSIVAVAMFVNLFISPGTGIEIMLHTSISILIYSVGYMGLKQPEIFKSPVAVKSNVVIPNTETEQNEPETEKYLKSGLNENAAETIKHKLLHSMDKNKYYLDSELTLSKLAGLLEVSQHNLSEVINSKLNQTYYDFINNYRVEEFKKRILDPANQNYSLLSIALDSGFKSKTTFNTIFKKITGLTPSEYKIKSSLENSKN